MADIKWIKITTDMFDNRKIRHLRRLPEGNNIVLIWVMLLTMAGRCNSSGLIFLTENIPYTPKMLADELNFEENTIRLALEALEQLGMIVTDNGFFSISGWEEHQNIEGLEKIREQGRIRKQKQREREKMLISDKSRDMSRDVTQQNKNKNKNKDKEEEIYTASVDFERAWQNTLGRYPKKRREASAKQIWLRKLLSVIPERREQLATDIYRAIALYLKDYQENKPDDAKFEYIPKFDEWLEQKEA